MAQLVNQKTSFPLSQVQQKIWFLYKLAPEGVNDKVFFAVRITSLVDREALGECLQKLIDRHATLRSYYYELDGQVVQEIHGTVEAVLDEIDAASLRWDDLQDTLLSYAQRPFNLEQGSVIRAGLFSRSAAEHILLLTVHHIASDFSSLLVLVDELFLLYQSKITGINTYLPPIEGLYKDYVLSEEKILNSSEGARLGKYWQKHLVGELPVLELPTLNSRPPIRTYNGSSYTFKINNELTTRLRILARAENVSLYDTLLAAFQVILHRYSGEEDILIACSLPEIKYPELAGVVGNFENPVVFRETICGSLTFKGLIDRVSKKLKEAIAFRDYPFPLLVKEFQQKSDLSHSPICQVGFSFQNLGSVEFLANLFEPSASWDLKYFELTRQKSEWELALEIIELKESTIGYFKYNSDFLDASTVARIAGHFQNLLEAIAFNPNLEVAQLPVLSPSDRHQLLIDWNSTKQDYPSLTIHQLFEAQVELTPDAVAVGFEEEQLTYRELNSRANQIAHYLQALGVEPDVLVGICVERSLDMVVGLLGILKAGGAYVPIDPAYPPERLAYMLEDSQVKVLLTQQKLLGVPSHQAQVVYLDKDWETIQQHREDNPNTGVNPQNLAYVLYTSGSTGLPKGVQIAHQSVVNFLNSMRQAPGLTEQDIILAVTTISFDIATLELYLPLIVGARLVLVSREVAADGMQLHQLLVKCDVTAMQATPATWRLLLAAGWEGSPRLKILCGGEALPSDLASRLLEKSASLWNLYGPTETTIWSTVYNLGAYRQVARKQDAPVLLGHPIANTQIYILDRYLQPVPIGVTGELHIGGIGLARGYLNRPDLTAEKFIPNPFEDLESSRLYKTGDLARYLPDGNIEYIGRIDNQVKIRGFRIELGEIEKALAKHSEVLQSVVIPRTEAGYQQLVAYVVPKQEQPLPSTLRSFLQQKLPDYMVPAAFVVLDSLPLTPNGKINRRALPAPDKSSFPNTSFVPPRDRIEQQLAQIWSEILDLHPVGVKDNFFDLGGYSFLALKLMAKIQQQFGKNLPLATLFQAPTIEELAKIIQSSTYVPINSSLVPIQPKGNKTPFFCVHPAWGHVLCYVKLSRYLGKEQPFYGLQALGFNEGEEPLSRIEDMACHYIKAIQTVQPEGPYQIGGWSFGGVVAYEIAQQLHQQGHEVSLLAMLDSYVPILLDPNKKIDNAYLVGVLSRVFGGMFGEDNLVSPEELQGISLDKQIDYIIEKARRVNIFPPEVQQQQNRRIIDVLVGTLKATYTYVRRPYPGKATILRAREKGILVPDPTLVWVEFGAVLAAREIEVIEVPGTHYTFVLEPHLPVLAERLGACLNKLG